MVKTVWKEIMDSVRPSKERIPAELCNYEEGHQEDWNI